MIIGCKEEENRLLVELECEKCLSTSSNNRLKGNKNIEELEFKRKMKDKISDSVISLFGKKRLEL